MKILKNRQIIISLIIALLIFMALPSTASAKAGGVGSNNITSITLDNSQSPPTCGRSGTCHTDPLLTFGADFNLTITSPKTVTTNESFTISVLLEINETVDEVGCMIMNRTNPDGTVNWAQDVNVIVQEVNATGTSINYYEAIGVPLNYNYTLIATTSGAKNLTIECRGGLATVGQQDWWENITLNFIANDISLISPCVDFEVRFIGNHYACPADSCFITIDTNGNFTFMNISIDNGTEIEICENGTLEQFQLLNLESGIHTLNISTKIGEEIIKIKIVSDVLNGTELADAVWQHNETERTTNNYFDRVLGGDIMTNEILFFLTIATLLIIIGFKTQGAANLPIFGMAGIIFIVLGLFVLDTTPFDLFVREVPFTDIGLLNLTAIWSCFMFAVILLVYPAYIYSKRRADS